MDRRDFLLSALLMLTGASAGAQQSAGQARPWPAWDRARRLLISPEGRVIDASDPRMITTSEGQSYGLFMALVNNDYALFRTLLAWTREHLAGGDLGEQLPAWLWGKQASGTWGILDPNSAADSDLWIAYCLLEAGRLWELHEFTSQGIRMLQRIARTEVLAVPGLGLQLLPAPQGFVHESTWRLNPSYVPPQLLARARLAQPGPLWQQLEADSLTFLLRCSPNGLVPDWALWTGDEFNTEEPAQRYGSYDAIRVYLWVGMLADNATKAAELKKHFSAIGTLVQKAGVVPEKIDVLSSKGQGEGPGGFAAALLPLLKDHEAAPIVQRALTDPGASNPGYYSQMLMLFSDGWVEGKYRFDASGQLITDWAS